MPTRLAHAGHWIGALAAVIPVLLAVAVGFSTQVHATGGEGRDVSDNGGVTGHLVRAASVPVEDLAGAWEAAPAVLAAALVAARPLLPGLSPAPCQGSHRPRELGSGSSFRARRGGDDTCADLSARRHRRGLPALGPHAPARAHRRRRAGADPARALGPAALLLPPPPCARLGRAYAVGALGARLRDEAGRHVRALVPRLRRVAHPVAVRLHAHAPADARPRARHLRPRRVPRLVPADRSGGPRHARLRAGSRSSSRCSQRARSWRWC